MEEILQTEGLSVGYDKKAVIEGVDISALKGQTICLIGPNGAGKTTILRTLTGMLSPVKGAVYVGGEDVGKMKPGKKARQLAVVLTERLNLQMTTVFAVTAMGRTPYTGFFGRLSQEDRKIVDQCLETVGALELKDRDYNSLSDGEKQKVLIARALAQTPELIVLDEPTSHLDIKHKIEVIRILNRLALETGLTVILSLHDIDIAVKFCQTVLMVKDGRVVGQGRPEEIIEKDTLGKLYDIQGASYDSVLGSVEICNEAEPEIFVAAGGGRGIPVYRMASRMGLGIATGILTENDIDFAVASDMHLSLISGPGFEPFSEGMISEAREWISKCPTLIDSGFPVGEGNRENITLLREAAKQGKTLYCLRSPEEAEKLYGSHKNLTPVSSLGEITKIMKRSG